MMFPLKPPQKWWTMPIMSNKFLFWTLVALNVLDVILTKLIIGLGGWEANPWIALFINQFGFYPGVILAKSPPIVTMGVVLYFLWEKLSNSFRKFVRVMLVLVNSSYAYKIKYYHKCLNLES